MPAQELTQLRVGIQGQEEAAACLEGVFCATGLEALPEGEIELVALKRDGLCGEFE